METKTMKIAIFEDSAKGRVYNLPAIKSPQAHKVEIAVVVIGSYLKKAQIEILRRLNGVIPFILVVDSRSSLLKEQLYLELGLKLEEDVLSIERGQDTLNWYLELIGDFS